MHLFRKALCAATASLMVAAATIATAPAARAQGFVHPGCLETAADFSRMHTKVVTLAENPWDEGWDLLIESSNPFGQPSYTPTPQSDLTRTGTGGDYNYAMWDAAAAYQLSLRWQINGDTSSAAAAVNILNAWANTLTDISGDPNVTLCCIYGYEFACAGENLRNYSGWSPTAIANFKEMMAKYFYPLGHEFLTGHDGTCPSYMWANWDLCSMADEISIGILCDNRSFYNDGVYYWYNGIGNGRIDWNSSNDTGTVVAEFDSNTLGQGQEEGRDQGHSGLDMALEGEIGTMAQSQGDNLFGYNSNKITSLCEYFAEYNLGGTVPFTSYSNCQPGTMTAISSSSQGDRRPVWDLLYNQFVNRMKISAPNTTTYASDERPDSGPNYSETSGGFDQLGYTTLTHYIDSEPIAPGNYKIQSHGDSNYIDNLGSKSNGASVAQWPSSSGTNQEWSVSYLGNGYYNITNATSNMHLDNLGNTAGGSVAGQWQAVTGPNQQWMIVPDGSYYQIVNYGTGLCLDTGGSTTSGAAIVQNSPGSTNNQLWSFTSASAGGSTPSISLNSSSNVVKQSAGTMAGWVGASLSYQIVASGGPTSYGASNLPAGLSVNTSSGVISGTPTTAGKWTATVSATNSSGTTGTGALYITINGYSEPVSNGTYKIINRNTGYCLDASGGATANGTTVIQWPYSAAANQKWTLTYQGTGWYEITNVNSSTSLDLSEGDSYFDIWSYSGGTNQQYYLISAGGGYYYISTGALGTTLPLCVQGASTSEGATISFELQTGGANEQWAFESP